MTRCGNERVRTGWSVSEQDCGVCRYDQSWLAVRPGRLLIDIRDGCLILTVRNPHGGLAKPEVELIRQVSAIVRGLGLTMATGVRSSAGRSVQVLEIAIDALDIASVRPFWRDVDISVPHDEACIATWQGRDD